MSKKLAFWEKDPSPDDLNAARLYLSMVLSPDAARKALSQFQRVSNTLLEAKDVLRASDLPLLEEDEPKVAEVVRRIEKKKKLSPVLLLRGDARKGVPMTVADGYHRICGSFYFDKKCPVACRIIS